MEARVTSRFLIGLVFLLSALSLTAGARLALGLGWDLIALGLIGFVVVAAATRALAR